MEYTSKTMQIGNVTVTIHRPILTDSERLQAEELIKNALASYGRAMEKSYEKQNWNATLESGIIKRYCISNDGIVRTDL